MATYRLQALLGIKERAEQDAKDLFGRAQAAMREQEKILADMEAELQRMIEGRERCREDYSKKLASGEMKSPIRAPRIASSSGSRRRRRSRSTRSRGSGRTSETRRKRSRRPRMPSSWPLRT